MSGREVDFVALVEGKAGGGSEKTGPVLKECQALFVKSIDEKKRRITALASAATLDRDSEIIEPEAFRKWLPVYMKNPIVITSHQHRLDSGRSSVIANVVDYKIDKKGLTVVIEFHDITGLSEEFWQLYSQKKQRALSIGFIPHAWEYGQDGDKQVKVFTELELLEISCVAVPSNREALSRSKQRKADFVAAKKTEHEDEKILAELRAEDPDFDKKAEEYADLLSNFEPRAENPDIDKQARLAALLKTSRELALVYGINGPYQRYLGYTQAVRRGLSVGHYGLDEIELYKAVESGDFDTFAEVVKAKIEVVRSKIKGGSKSKAIAGNNEPDYAAIVGGVG